MKNLKSFKVFENEQEKKEESLLDDPGFELVQPA